MGNESVQPSNLPSEACCEDNLPTEVHDESPLSDDLRVNGMLRHTFINAAPLPPTPAPRAVRRGQSVPKDAGLCRSKYSENSVGPGLDLRWLAEPASACPPLSFEPTKPRTLFCENEPLCFEDASIVDATMEYPAMTPTPLPLSSVQATHYKAHDLEFCLKALAGSRDVGTTYESLHQSCGDERSSLWESGSALHQAILPHMQSKSRVVFCPDQPLHFEDVHVPDGARDVPLVTPTPMPMYAPSSEPKRPAVFCADEPLRLEDAASYGGSIGFSMLTPTPVVTSAFSKYSYDWCVPMPIPISLSSAIYI